MTATSPSDSKLTCDCCNKNEAIGVASSGLGPISFAYCRECATKPAEPLMMFVYMYDHVSDRGEGLREEMNACYTYMDGAYVSWLEYVKKRREEDERATGVPAG